MKTAENGGFLGHIYFFFQNSILFHLPETLVYIIRVSRYERNSAPWSQQQILFRGTSVPSVGTVKTAPPRIFQNPYVKKLTPILVSGDLAAALLPVFGPVVAGTAAAVAIKNSLARLYIETSTDTIERLY